MIFNKHFLYTIYTHICTYILCRSGFIYMYRYTYIFINIVVTQISHKLYKTLYICTCTIKKLIDKAPTIFFQISIFDNNCHIIDRQSITITTVSKYDFYLFFARLFNCFYIYFYIYLFMYIDNYIYRYPFIFNLNFLVYNKNDYYL